MSRSKNARKKTYNWPLREARHWSKKAVRGQGRRVIIDILKAEDTEDVSTFIFDKNRSGKGNIWYWG